MQPSAAAAATARLVSSMYTYLEEGRGGRTLRVIDPRCHRCYHLLYRVGGNRSQPGSSVDPSAFTVQNGLCATSQQWPSGSLNNPE